MHIKPQHKASVYHFAAMSTVSLKLNNNSV